MEANKITDFFVWDLRRIFTAHEVAYLWFGLQPHYGNDHPGNITSFVLALSETQLRSELLLTGDTGRRYYTDNRGKRMEAWVKQSPDYERESLRSWAERIGQKPLFLFPECRKPLPLPLDNVAIVSDDAKALLAELSPSQAETVMVALGLMAKVLSNSPIYRRPGTTREPNVSRIQQAVLHEAEEMGIKSHGLGSALREKITEALKLLETKCNQSF